MNHEELSIYYEFSPHNNDHLTNKQLKILHFSLFNPFLTLPQWTTAKTTSPDKIQLIKS